MKKLFAGLLIMLCACFAVYSDEIPTPSLEDAVYDWGGVFKDISSSTAYDTLASGTPTKVILQNTKIDGGWEYILAHDTLTGTDAATCVIEIVIESYDDNNILLKRTIVDSIVGSSEQYGGAHVLPFFSETVGHKFKVVLQYDTGTQTIVNRLYIYKRRPVVFHADRR